jgi:hypothetical protein
VGHSGKGASVLGTAGAAGASGALGFAGGFTAGGGGASVVIVNLFAS